VATTYGTTKADERHRHRYEVNNDYRGALEDAGMLFSGTSPDGRLVEFVELPPQTHPYYVATQAHPEFLSRPNRAHPLFAGLIGAALRRQQEGRLVEVPLRDDAAVPPRADEPTAPREERDAHADHGEAGAPVGTRP
jgi:CTP synthase